MNVAHEEIDLKNPKTNKKNAGFTQQERGVPQYRGKLQAPQLSGQFERHHVAQARPSLQPRPVREHGLSSRVCASSWKEMLDNRVGNLEFGWESAAHSPGGICGHQ